MLSEELVQKIYGKIVELEASCPNPGQIDYRSRDIVKLCGAPDEVSQKYIIACSQILKRRKWRKYKANEGTRPIMWVFYRMKNTEWLK